MIYIVIVIWIIHQKRVVKKAAKNFMQAHKNFCSLTIVAVFCCRRIALRRSFSTALPEKGMYFYYNGAYLLRQVVQSEDIVS